MGLTLVRNEGRVVTILDVEQRVIFFFVFTYETIAQ